MLWRLTTIAKRNFRLLRLNLLQDLQLGFHHALLWSVSVEFWMGFLKTANTLRLDVRGAIKAQ